MLSCNAPVIFHVAGQGREIMGMIEWGEKKIKNMTFWDMGLTKLVLILFGVITGACISDFVKQNIVIFLVLFLAGYLVVILRVIARK